MMARWQEVIDTEPAFARAAQAIFDAHQHKTMATLRTDGSPRISGTEMQLTNGEAWLGMMPKSRKLADVLRDSRIAIHSASEDPLDDPSQGGWSGDAKLSGRLMPMSPAMRTSLGAASEAGAYFTIDIADVVLIRPGEPADHLVVQLWRHGRPLKTMRA